MEQRMEHMEQRAPPARQYGVSSDASALASSGGAMDQRPQMEQRPQQAYRATDSVHAPPVASPAMRPEDSVMTPNGTMTKVRASARVYIPCCQPMSP